MPGIGNRKLPEPEASNRGSEDQGENVNPTGVSSGSASSGNKGSSETDCDDEKLVANPERKARSPE